LEKGVPNQVKLLKILFVIEIEAFDYGQLGLVFVRLDGLDEREPLKIREDTEAPFVIGVGVGLQAGHPEGLGLELWLKVEVVVAELVVDPGVSSAGALIANVLVFGEIPTEQAEERLYELLFCVFFGEAVLDVAEVVLEIANQLLSPSFALSFWSVMGSLSSESVLTVTGICKMGMGKVDASFGRLQRLPVELGGSGLSPGGPADFGVAGAVCVLS